MKACGNMHSLHRRRIFYMFEAHASALTFASAAVATSVQMHLLSCMTLT